MGLEVGTFISDLVVTNPPSGDQIAQGDDHIRLLKNVLKNTFPTASKATYSPSVRLIVAGTTTATVADQNCFFQLYTNAGVVSLVMPTLSAGDAGWSCTVAKWGADVSPAFVYPPSGTILTGDVSVAYCRRCIPFSPRRVWWTGGNWVAERIPAVPIGTVLEYQGAGLPAGYEWPNGQSLTTSVYPEYATVRSGGLTQDRRGRFAAMADQGAARIGGGFTGGINTGAYDGVGGEYIHQLTQAELPAISPTFTGSSGTVNVSSSGAGVLRDNGISATTATTGNSTRIGAADGALASSGNFTPAGTISALGSNAFQNNLPPTLVTNFILVVE